MKLGTIGATVSVEPKADVHDISIPTLESIAYQRGDSFGPDLEALVLKFMEKVKAGANSVQIDSEHGLKEEFNKLVRKRLGINAILYCNGMMAATFPNTYVDHSPVIREGVREYMKIDQGVSGAIKLRTLKSGDSLGTVDTVKAKLSGWLSEQEVAVYINFNQLIDYVDLSSAEITAVILHELGHDFEGAAMAARATHTNLILSDVVRHISEDRSGAQEYIYRELSKIDKNLSRDTVEGLTNGNPVVMGVSMFRLTKGAIQSLSGSRVYEATNYEALSDSFATRFGYSAPLTTGLAKLGNGSDWVSVGVEIGQTIAAICICYSLYMMAKVLFAGVFSYKLVLGMLFQASTLMRIIRHNRTTTEDLTYDEDYDRFARIKKDLINGLKDAKIDAREKRAMLEQIQIVDKAMANSFNTPRVLRKLFDTVIISDARSRTSIEAQKQLENLIANDIFVSANKLAQKSA